MGPAPPDGTDKHVVEAEPGFGGDGAGPPDGASGNRSGDTADDNPFGGFSENPAALTSKNPAMSFRRISAERSPARVTLQTMGLWRRAVQSQKQRELIVSLLSVFLYLSLFCYWASECMVLLCKALDRQRSSRSLDAYQKKRARPLWPCSPRRRLGSADRRAGTMCHGYSSKPRLIGGIRCVGVPRPLESRRVLIQSGSGRTDVRVFFVSELRSTWMGRFDSISASVGFCCSANQVRKLLAQPVCVEFKQ